MFISYQQMHKSQYATESTKDFSDERPQHESKRSFFIELTIKIIYTLLKMSVIAAVAGSAGSLSPRQFQASSGFKLAQENIWLWQQEIIVDFRVVQAANCPQGWQEYTNYSWPGNTEGCSCSFHINLFEYDAILQGRCTHKQFQKGCVSVPQNQPIPFRFWRQDAHLCVLRLNNYNFYSSHKNIFNPHGYNITNCSMGNNYQIDLIEPVPCPVSTVINNTSLNQTLPQLNFSFSREDHYPVVHFRLSEYSFCQSLPENDKSPGRTSNYILQSNYQYQCTTKDSRTVVLDSQGEAELFRINPKIQYITSILPAYPQLTNDYTYNLGFIRYPAWMYHCRNTNDYNLNKATQFLTLSQISAMIGRFQALIILSTLFSFIFMVYDWVGCYFYLKTKYMHGYLYLKDYEIQKINPHSNIIKNHNTQIAKFIAFQVSPLFALIFLIVLYFQVKSAKEWFAAASICTEGSFIGYLKGYEQFLGGEMVIALTSIFIILGLISMDICYLMWRYFKGDLQQAEKEEQDKNTANEKDSDMKEYNLKQMNITQQFLVDNTFAVDNGIHPNIYTFEQESDEGRISEYSQSSKSD